MMQQHDSRPDVGQVSWVNEEIAEVSLLMPGWQLSQLVSLATSQRLTVGQLLRTLIRSHLAQNAAGNNDPRLNRLALT
jgi:hypothetical protein